MIDLAIILEDEPDEGIRIKISLGTAHGLKIIPAVIVVAAGVAAGVIVALKKKKG